METRQEGGRWLQSAWGRSGDIKAPRCPSQAASGGGASRKGQNSGGGGSPGAPRACRALCRLSLLPGGRGRGRLSTCPLGPGAPALREACLSAKQEEEQGERTRS